MAFYLSTPMSQGTRLSAFAKRRKIDRDVVSSSATTPEAEVAKGGSSSSVTEDVDQSESQRLRVKTKIRRKKMLQSVTEQIDVQNPFAALVQTQAVQFNGTREIDQLNQTSVKVRLSYGSNCTFTGKAKLWIREGTLSVYGATLEASPAVYNLSASEWSSLPLLTAMSETVEFQLESRNTATKPKHRPEIQGTKPGAAQHPKQTFGIISQDQSALPPLEISSLEHVPEITQNRSNIDGGDKHGPLDHFKPTTTRFFIAGKRSSSTAIATVVLTNLLLSEQLRAGRDPGVAVLDLDHICPLRSVPGTVGLVLVRQLLLNGTDFYDSHNDAATLLRSIWVSATDSTKLDQVGDGTLLEMLKDDRLSIGIPVVVRGGGWITHVTNEHSMRLAREVGRCKFVYIDNTQTSPYFQSCKRMAEFFEQELDIRPVHSETSLSSNAEHKASVRLVLCNEKSKHIHELSYNGDDKVLDFFTLQGGSLRPVDVLEVLTGALVAVVLVKDKNDGESLVDVCSKESPALAKTEAAQSNTPIPISTETVIGAICLGLGIIQSLDISAAKLQLITEIGLEDLMRARQARQRVGVVLEKPSNDGRFSRDNLKL